MISVVGVLVFAGLTAWDTQRLKTEYLYGAMDGETAERSAIIGALSLYLNFINLFTLLLQLLGQRENRPSAAIDAPSRPRLRPGPFYALSDPAPKHSVTTPGHLWRSARRYTRFQPQAVCRLDTAGRPRGPAPSGMREGIPMSDFNMEHGGPRRLSPARPPQSMRACAPT